MEEFKGTNGEWEIKTGNEENGRGKFSITTDESNIATIWDAVEEEETIHNAKLIAAAPDLLEALQNLIFLHSCEQEGIGNSQPKPSQWFEAVDKAETAIAKALGKNF